MTRQSVVRPYAQLTPAAMTTLLASTHPRFATSAARLEFIESVVDDASRPERAVAHYRGRQDGEERRYSFDYTRMDLDRYCDLYRVNYRFLPFGDEVDELRVLSYILDRFQVFLPIGFTDVSVAAEADESGAYDLSVIPYPDNPVWYGTLRLKVVAENDLRAIAGVLMFPELDPTLLETV